MPAKRKNTDAGFAAVFSNKEKNCDGESVLCIGRISSLLMYISYHRFLYCKFLPNYIHVIDGRENRGQACRHGMGAVSCSTLDS